MNKSQLNLCAILLCMHHVQILAKILSDYVNVYIVSVISIQGLFHIRKVRDFLHPPQHQTVSV